VLLTDEYWFQQQQQQWQFFKSGVFELDIVF
jgi:hypothetical protein